MADKYDIVNPNRQYNDWGSIEQQIINLDRKIDEAITGNVDYNLARNKPQINGISLAGNKTSTDLGIVQDLRLSIDEQNNLTVTLRSGEININSDTVNIPTASAIKNVYMDYATNTIVIEFANDQVLSIPLEELVSMMLPIHCQLVLSTNWSQITDTDNYEQDLTWQINYILGQIPLYNRIYPIGTENPSQLGWYEKNPLGQYVLTEDTAVVDDKAYYERVYKTLTANDLMEITVTPDIQSIINNSACSRITLETSVINDTPILKAIAEGGYPNSQFTINVTINSVVNLTQATLLSNPIYNNDILLPYIEEKVDKRTTGTEVYSHSNGAQGAFDVSTSISANSTDAQIGTAKAVYDRVAGIKIGYASEGFDEFFERIDVPQFSMRTMYTTGLNIGASQGAGWLMLFNNSIEYRKIIYLPYGSNQVWCISKVASVWGSWQKVSAI